MSGETWYRASLDLRPRIEPVEAVKVTNSMITYIEPGDSQRREIKHARRGMRYGFFPTWELAWEHLEEKAADDLQLARQRLQAARDKYGNVKGMRK